MNDICSESTQPRARTTQEKYFYVMARYGVSAGMNKESRLIHEVRAGKLGARGILHLLMFLYQRK